MNVTLQVPSAATSRGNSSPSTPTASTSPTNKYALTSPSHSRFAATNGNKSPKSKSPNSKNPKVEEKQDVAVWRTSRAKDLFKQFDTNKDRFLQKDEFAKGLSMFLELKVDSPKRFNKRTAKKTKPIVTEDSTTTEEEESKEEPQSCSASENGERKEETSDTSNNTIIRHMETLQVCTDIIEPPMSPLAQSAIEALWVETDIDGDNKISLAEFLYRFADGEYPVPVSKTPKATLILQAMPVKLGTGATLLPIDLKAVLLNLYDGTRMRFPSVDISKCEQVSVFVLKKMLTEIVAAEKAEAEEQNRKMEPWAQRVTDLGGINSKNAEKFFKSLDTQKIGRVDLAPIFAACKLLPPTRQTSNGKGKKSLKKNSFPFKTVLEKSFIHWLNDAVFNHVHKEFYPEIKCHPALKHWGQADRNRKALLTDGYETPIYLSERTKILSITEINDPELITRLISGENLEESKTALDDHTPDGKEHKKSKVGKSTSKKTKSTKKSDKKPTETKVDPEKSSYYVFFLTRSELTKKCRRETLWFGYMEIDKEEKIASISSIQRRRWNDSEVDRNWEDNVRQLEDIQLHSNDQSRHETILNEKKFCSNFNFAIWNHFIKAEPEKEELPIPIQ